VITTAGLLPAKYVIHTVGPVWNGGHKGEPELLASCYRNALQLAVANGVTTIAFPNISTGIYRFPKPEAAAIAIKEVQQFMANDNPMDEIFFVCFDEENYSLYKEKLEE
jgi:O-acetyl-ADP-ribose deacetylase